jgi:uncharacterized protein YndB with AHSA1/START domain
MTIRKSITVARPADVAFRVFCEEIGEWWPGGFGGKDVKVFLETRVGGRFGERRPDGSEYVTGHVTSYEPPHLVAFSWRAPGWDLDTHVEVRFIARGGETRIELEHTGWERDAKTREAHKRYDEGWDFVLGTYAKYAAENSIEN